MTNPRHLHAQKDDWKPTHKALCPLLKAVKAMPPAPDASYVLQLKILDADEADIEAEREERCGDSLHMAEFYRRVPKALKACVAEC